MPRRSSTPALRIADAGQRSHRLARSLSGFDESLDSCTRPCLCSGLIVVGGGNQLHIDAHDATNRKRATIYIATDDELFGHDGKPAKENKYAIGFGIVGGGESSDCRRRHSNLI